MRTLVLILAIAQSTEFLLKKGRFSLLRDCGGRAQAGSSWYICVKDRFVDDIFHRTRVRRWHDWGRRYRGCDYAAPRGPCEVGSVGEPVLSAIGRQRMIRPVLNQPALGTLQIGMRRNGRF